MKKNIKIYITTFFISVFFISIGWFLAYIGVWTGLDVISNYSIILAFVSLVLSAIIILKRVEKLLLKIIMIIFNPSIIYLIFILILFIEFSKSPFIYS